MQVIEEVKKLRFVKPAENEILLQKTKELQQGEQNLKNLRRQVDILKKTYKSESYTEMISLINKNKSGAVRLQKIVQENEQLRQQLSDLMMTLEQSDTAQGKKMELNNLKHEVSELSAIIRKLRLKTKTESKKVLDKHETAIAVETRCRNMKQIIRYKKIEQRQLDIASDQTIDESTVAEAEERYQTLIFQKEELLI